MIAGKQILVVEDEIITGMDIQNGLKNLGYNVPVVVSSGEEAIKKVKENNPDLVLMDINLNSEMDGIEAASKIHSFSDIPVIYLTAYSDDKTLKRAKITEPYAYIVKPLKYRELQINIEIAFYKNAMEKKLREKNQWLGAVIESIGDGVIATDPEGTIRLMNPIAEALTGWKQHEALGKPLAKVFKIISEETDIKTENPVKKAIRNDMFYGLADHTLLVTKEGMKIPVDIIGSTIKIDGNTIIGIVLIFYDISDRARFNGRHETLNDYTLGIKELDNAIEGIKKGSNIILMGPPMSGKEIIFHQIMYHGVAVHGNAIINVTTNEPATQILERFKKKTLNLPLDRIGIIDCTKILYSEEEENENIKIASSPVDLTGIGVKISHFLDEFLIKKKIQRSQLHINSLSTILMYSNIQLIFRFLHSFTGRIKSNGALGIYMIEKNMHDDQTLAILKQLCDGIIEIESENNKHFIRMIGLSSKPTPWFEYEIERDHIKIVGRK